MDERFGVALDGVTRLESEQSEDVKARLKAEQDAIQRDVERLTAAHGPAAPVVEAAQSGDAPWRALGRHQGLARLLKDRLRLEVQALTPDIVFNVLHASGANYVVAVNDRRGFGPFLGQWQRCREQGVPQRAKFRVRKAFGAAAYDLTRSGRLPFKAEGDSWLLEVDLPPCAGAIVAFYPEAIGPLAVSTPATVARGEDAKLDLSLLGVSGKPLPGLVPVRLDITAPDGQRSAFSRCTVIENGRLSVSIPVALNDRQGEWHATARELATGQEAKGRWRVP